MTLFCYNLKGYKAAVEEAVVEEAVEPPPGPSAPSNQPLPPWGGGAVYVYGSDGLGGGSGGPGGGSTASSTTDSCPCKAHLRSCGEVFTFRQRSVGFSASQTSGELLISLVRGVRGAVLTIQ